MRGNRLGSCSQSKLHRRDETSIILPVHYDNIMNNNNGAHLLGVEKQYKKKREGRAAVGNFIVLSNKSVVEKIVDGGRVRLCSTHIARPCLLRMRVCAWAISLYTRQAQGRAFEAVKLLY